MPNLDVALLAASDDEVLSPVQEGVVDLAVALQVFVGGVSEHGLEVAEGAHRPVALVLTLEAVLQHLLHAEPVEVRTLAPRTAPPRPHPPRETVLAAQGGGGAGGTNLLLLLPDELLQTQVLRLLLGGGGEFLREFEEEVGLGGGGGEGVVGVGVGV